MNTRNSKWTNGSVSQNSKSFLAVALLVSFLSVALSSGSAMAQHEMPGMAMDNTLLQGTMPANDEVVAVAPESLMLHFGANVRLVKLAVKESEQGEILIDFRYKPTAGVHFTQALPKLAAANYYTVEWAALEASGNLVRGRFRFSFGDGAKPPSSYMGEMDHRMNIMSPDFRLQ